MLFVYLLQKLNSGLEYCFARHTNNFYKKELTSTVCASCNWLLAGAPYLKKHHVEFGYP